MNFILFPDKLLELIQLCKGDYFAYEPRLMSCHRADMDLGEAIFWWLIIQGLFCNGSYSIICLIYIKQWHITRSKLITVGNFYVELVFSTERKTVQHIWVWQTGALHPEITVLWGSCSWLLTIIKLQRQPSTSNWSSFLTYESAPKLQFSDSMHCTSTLVLGLKAVSVSTRETWIWLKEWLKVELIPFRIKDVVFASFLPVLTGWLIRFFCIVLPYATMSLQFCAKINVV